jgi:hypothetical protein
MAKAESKTASAPAGVSSTEPSVASSGPALGAQDPVAPAGKKAVKPTPRPDPSSSGKPPTEVRDDRGAPPPLPKPMATFKL